jgi:hypothetical protein
LADFFFGGGASEDVEILGETATDVAGEVSPSPDAPDESLRNFCRRFVSFWGGGIETAVETVGFEGASPVGVLARGMI